MPDTNTQQKHSSGRKSVMTNEVLAKLRAAFMMDCTEEEACAYAKIDPATLWRYKQRNPQFCKDIDAYRRNPLLKAKATLYRNLDKPTIALWYLERKAKDEYSTKQEIEHSGNQDKPLFYLPDNERDKTDH